MAESTATDIQASQKNTAESSEKSALYIKPGMTVRVHQRITEQGAKGEKERIQIFEGIVLARRGGKQTGATITVRKISDGVGVEKIFPLSAPSVVKIVPIKQAKVRQAKAYYLRGYKKRLKEVKIANS